jgi:hypothetical protein
MSRPGENESPFKKDEPVSGSRKWMLLLLMWCALVVGGVVIGCCFYPPSLGELDISGFVTVLQGFITAVVFVAVMLRSLWRLARDAKACRQKRSFDMMAFVVRGQRRFWMVLAVLWAFNVMAMTVGCIAEQARLRGAQNLLKKHQAEMARGQQNITNQ